MSSIKEELLLKAKRDISKFKFNANKIANKAGEEIKEAGGEVIIITKYMAR